MNEQTTTWPENMTTQPTDDVVSMLIEAADEMDGDWSYVGGQDPATYSGGLRTFGRAFSGVYDRSDGRFLPFYEHEHDLRRMRAKCRRLATFTSIAVGAVQALQVYVMGGDWEYEVEPKDGQEPHPDLVKEVQKVIDENLERNEWIGDLDNEIHDASREDGESPVALYGTPDGLVDIRRLEADNIREPANGRQIDQWLRIGGKTSWTFGVHTVECPRQRRIDHTRAAGYHVVFDDGGTNWDYLPAWPHTNLGESSNKCLHLIKRNTPRSAKRGISDYWPVLTDLEREDKLSDNMSVGAAIQAAIPWIEELPPGTTRDAAQSELSNALDTFSRAVTANRGGERTVQRYRAGTVLKVGAGRKYHAGPMGALRQPVYIECGQALKRRIGTRWLMPEYMISGDASNANFASTLVSESPFVKAREGDQQFYVRRFRTLLFKALKIACDAGRFRRWCSSWVSLYALIDIAIKPPQVASRDKAAMLEEAMHLYDRGLMDGNEVRTDFRREPKEELEGKTGQRSTMRLGDDFQFGTVSPPLPQQAALGARRESLAVRAIDSLIERGAIGDA